MSLAAAGCCWAHTDADQTRSSSDDILVHCCLGTYFWHDHSSANRADGLSGPLIVTSTTKDPIKKAYAYDEEKTIYLSDWWHAQGASLAMHLNRCDFSRPGFCCHHGLPFNGRLAHVSPCLHGSPPPSTVQPVLMRQPEHAVTMPEVAAD